MNEEMNKALVYFGREDLTDGLYENDIDDNVQVFLTIRQMIKLYNLQSKIDKAIEYIEKKILNNKIEKVDWNFDDCYYSDMPVERIKPLIDILKGDK